MFHLPSGPAMVFIFGLALIVFGPKKLPEIARTIGQGLRELRKASREITDALDISDVTSAFSDVKSSLSDATSRLPRVSDFLSDDGYEPDRVADTVPDPVVDADQDSQKENENDATNSVWREPDGVGMDNHPSDPAVRSEEAAGDRQVDG